MKTVVKKLFCKVTNKSLLLFGLCIVMLSQLPYLILGEGAVIPYHDQLDGELIAYIYQAKYLFSGLNVIPEFLCGASKTALWPPAPFAVLLFKVFSPFTALMLLQVSGQLTAFAGMFCLTNRVLAYGGKDSGRADKSGMGSETADARMTATEIAGAKWIAFIVGFFYAFIPFLPVYGLSQYGMPLLLLCIWQLYEKKHIKGSVIYVAVYGAMSSLVLCGFAWLGLWGLALLVMIARRELGKHKPFLAGFAVLLGVYIAENFALIAQMLGFGEAGVSHKSEYVLVGGAFWQTFWDYFRNNAEHSADNHLWIALLTVLLLIIILIFRKKCSELILGMAKSAIVFLGCIVLLCLAAALWECSFGLSFREHMGALGAFQIGRVLWLTPMLWRIELALCLAIMWNAMKRYRWIGYGISVVLLGTAALGVMKNALVKPCLQQFLNPNYKAISYEDYLAVGVMEQVEDFIAETEGRQKADYRVASLGIDPAAALYHGFYTVDGYSNNYNLEYKHAFRKVIAPELEKSAYLQDYYDNWGNRCYLYSAECPGYYTVEKGGFYYNHLSIDTKALGELGCDYVLSAAWIADAEEKNLQLLNEEAFETSDSYYRIFIYKIKPE